MAHLFSKTKLKALVIVAVLSVGMFSALIIASNSVVFADAKADVCAGIAATGGGACGAGATPLNNALKFAITALSLIAGIIGVVMIMVSGIKYMTSQGDANQINSAKNSLIYAIIGLVVAAMAQFVVHYVLAKVK